MKSRFDKILEERFGKAIGDYAGEPLAGVRDEREDEYGIVEECKTCEMLPIEDQCGCGEEMCDGCGMPISQCTCQQSETCPVCGMMKLPAQYEMTGPSCQCGMTEAKRRGPTKKAARKILKGAKTFSQKMARVSGWAEKPGGAAMWMTMKAGLKPHGK